MSRPLRIQYPNAWYHVMNRGRRAERIFNDEDDYTMFIELLKEASEAWNIRICAYCLMPNHYHLLVQTPEANISRAMRHINGIYTQRFNRRHGCDGQLFRGRYKSIVVDANSYLLQLVRYIHSNPAKAGIAPMDRYQWSSHKGYLSIARKWDWIYKSFVFRLLSKNKKNWIKKYRQLMSEEDDGDLAGIIEGKKWPSILGGKSFTDWIKGQYHDLKDDLEVPAIRELAPEADKIKSTVCDYYAVEPASLYRTKRGEFNEARNVAAYLLRRLRRDSLKSIGEQLHIRKYSSASSAIERLKIKIKKDRHLKQRIDTLINLIGKSQGQT